jgi:phage shock protein PspC (stress-responsive transcriptional regulator)
MTDYDTVRLIIIGYGLFSGFLGLIMGYLIAWLHFKSMRVQTSGGADPAS